MMMFFELFLLRKISEFSSGTRTHNLQIASETMCNLFWKQTFWRHVHSVEWLYNKTLYGDFFRNFAIR